MTEQCAAPLSDASKVPAVAFGLWVIKILATKLGETRGASVTMPPKLGYLGGTAIFAGMFTALVWWRVEVTKFHPAIFWATIVASITLGTTVADVADRALGIGYPGSVAIIGGLLATRLLVWHWSQGTVSVSSIDLPRAAWSTGARSCSRRRLKQRSATGWPVFDRGGFGIGLSTEPCSSQPFRRSSQRFTPGPRFRTRSCSGPLSC